MKRIEILLGVCGLYWRRASTNSRGGPQWLAGTEPASQAWLLAGAKRGLNPPLGPDRGQPDNNPAVPHLRGFPAAPHQRPGTIATRTNIRLDHSRIRRCRLGCGFIHCRSLWDTPRPVTPPRRIATEHRSTAASSPFGHASCVVTFEKVSLVNPTGIGLPFP